MISQDLVNYIRQLTLGDKKTLSQKALKTAEEVGELAKCVLPYDNAHGTTHRFIHKSKILEEVADTMLTAVSIAYDLGATDEELEQMLWAKANKWADVQSRSTRIKYPVPYEIHITVDTLEASIDEFKDACRVLGVKPILLDLHITEAITTKDMMTSSVHMGNNRSAFEEMKRISKGLDDLGWDVLREKIETVPWHPAAPSRQHDRPEMPPHCYFECHLNVITHPGRMEYLDQIATKWKARKSRNIFKKLDDELVTVMITYRNSEPHVTNELFQEHIADIKEDLEEHWFEIEKEIVEFSIYDTNVSHDTDWITGKAKPQDSCTLLKVEIKPHPEAVAAGLKAAKDVIESLSAKNRDKV